eukprot:3668554-Rhodomonas_salina.1
MAWQQCRWPRRGGCRERERWGSVGRVGDPCSLACLTHNSIAGSPRRGMGQPRDSSRQATRCRPR